MAPAVSGGAPRGGKEEALPVVVEGIGGSGKTEGVAAVVAVGLAAAPTRAVRFRFLTTRDCGWPVTPPPKVMPAPVGARDVDGSGMDKEEGCSGMVLDIVGGGGDDEGGNSKEGSRLRPLTTEDKSAVAVAVGWCCCSDDVVPPIPSRKEKEDVAATPGIGPPRSPSSTLSCDTERARWLGIADGGEVVLAVTMKSNTLVEPPAAAAGTEDGTVTSAGGAAVGGGAAVARKENPDAAGCWPGGGPPPAAAGLLAVPALRKEKLDAAGPATGLPSAFSFLSGVPPFSSSPPNIL